MRETDRYTRLGKSGDERVLRVGKWVTFEDASGVKQVRAPRNLIVVEDVGHNSGTTSSRRG